jgi:hypothetical protein
MPMRAQRLTIRALELMITGLVHGRSDAAAANA